MLLHLAPIESERVDLDNACGRILAAPLSAQRDQPPRDVSAMDGYALRTADAPGALSIVGESAAGRPFDGALPRNACIRISTGAIMPPGADSVLIQEDARVEGAALITQFPLRGANVRRRGGDFTAGSHLLAAGRRLTVGDVTLAAATGAAHLMVARAPRISILCSGDELRQPGEVASDFEIFNSASYGVAALARAWGAKASHLQPCPDDVETIARSAETALEACDLLVVIGGASVGLHDLARIAVSSLDLKIVVEKVSVKPGKPTWFAHGNLGAVLGLPGNPASALVCARLFLASAIEAMLGMTTLESVQLGTAPLVNAVPASGARETYLRAALIDSERGNALRCAGDQDSSLVSELSNSNALLRQPANDPKREIGDVAQYLRWTPS